MHGDPNDWVELVLKDRKPCSVAHTAIGPVAEDLQYETGSESKFLIVATVVFHYVQLMSGSLSSS